MGWHGVERETGGGIALSTFCTWDQVKALPTKQVNKKIHIPDVLLLPPLFYGAWSTPGRGRTGVGLTLPVFMERGSRLPLPPPPREGLIYNGSSSVFQQTLLDPHKPDTILSPGEVKTVLLGMWSPPRGSSAGLAMWTYPQIPVLASGP